MSKIKKGSEEDLMERSKENNREKSVEKRKKRKKNKKTKNIKGDVVEAFVPTDKGATRIDVKMVSVDELEPNEWNYNEQSDFMMEKLEKSILEFGFTEPITVRSANQEGKLSKLTIIGGEHRWIIAKKLGMKEVPINDIGMVSDNELKKLMIVLNETKGRANPDQLSLLLSELSNADVDLDVLPYDEAELSTLVSVGDFDWDTLDTSAVEDVNDVDEQSDEEDEDEEEQPPSDDLYDLLGLDGIPDKLCLEVIRKLRKVIMDSEISPASPWKVWDVLMEDLVEDSDE